MKQEQNQTLERILDAARQEFREKGFQKASLRHIVKVAGVTTGAFYGYFRTKEELFDAIVGPHARALLGMYDAAVERFWQMSPQEQEAHTGDIGGACMQEMVCYCYDHLEECQLLLTASAGTEHENFLHALTVREEEATHRFMEKLRGRGHAVTDVDSSFEHIITSGMFASMVEPVIHGMPREEALRSVAQVHDFYTAGWQHLMGLGASAAGRR